MINIIFAILTATSWASPYDGLISKPTAFGSEQADKIDSYVSWLTKKTSQISQKNSSVSSSMALTRLQRGNLTDIENFRKKVIHDRISLLNLAKAKIQGEAIEATTRTRIAAANDNVASFRLPGINEDFRLGSIESELKILGKADAKLTNALNQLSKKVNLVQAKKMATYKLNKSSSVNSNLDKQLEKFTTRNPTVKPISIHQALRKMGLITSRILK